MTMTMTMSGEDDDGGTKRLEMLMTLIAEEPRKIWEAGTCTSHPAGTTLSPREYILRHCRMRCCLLVGMFVFMVIFMTLCSMIAAIKSHLQ